MANNETTTKFKVDISELKSAMQTAKREIALANSEFKAASTSMENWAKTSTGLEAKLKQLDSVLSSQKNVLDVLKQQYSAVAQAEGENSKAAQDLMIKINNQQAAVNKTQNEYRQYDSQLKEVVEAEKKLGDESGDLSSDIAESGESAKESGDGFTVMKGALANLVADGIRKGVEALKEFVGSIQETAKAVDELSTNSLVTGIDVTTLQEWEYASQFIDTSVDTMTGAMTKLIRNMSNGGSSVTAAFEKLNISVKDSNNQLRNSNTVFMEIINALGNVQNETERDALAMTIFGKSARELNPLIEAGSDELSKLSAEAHEVGAVMSEDMVDSYNALNDAMDKMHSATKGLGNAIGSVFAPVLTVLANAISNFVIWLNKGGVAQSIFKALIISLIAVLITLALVSIPTVISALIAMIPAIGAVNVALSTLMANPVVLTIAAIVGAIALLITAVKSLSDYLLDNSPAVNNFIDSIINGVENLKDTISKVFNTIKTTIKSLPDTLSGVVKNTISLLDNLAKQGKNSALNFVNGVANNIRTLPNKITVTLQGVLSRVNSWGSSLVSYGRSAISQFISGITSALSQLSYSFSGSLNATLQSVYMWGSSLASAGRDAISQFVNTVINTVRELPDRMREIGQQIVSGVWDGIQAKANEFYNNVRNFFQGIVKTVQEVLGIKSPSRVFRDSVGKWIPLGVALGIDDNASSVMDSLKNLTVGMMDTAKDGLSKGVSGISNGSVGGYGSTQVVNNYNQTINSPKALSRLDIYRQSKNLLGYVGGVS